MKKIIFIMSIVFIITVLFYQTGKEKYYIPDDSIRFRIIANSDNNIDQTTKQQIKKELEQSFFPLVENSPSKEDTKKIILNNQDIIKTTIDKYNIPYTINYGQNYFPTKEYQGITYEPGNYESLIISLGEAKGNNWWCVMYPPLCLLETKEEKESEEVEYTSFIKEIIKKLTS